MFVKRVLIFDSGVGGLSIYSEIAKINPTIKCHYLFDNAYFPYGELPRDKLVHRITQLLTDFTKQYPTDLIVIACNSASTIALDALRAVFSVPIVGVVPAIKPATLITQNNVIGLLATPGTIERAYTETLIKQFAAEKMVLRIGSTKLVTLAEDKLLGKTLDQEDFKKILAPWTSAQQAEWPDTLVLGCTHFPLIKEEIRACFSYPIHFVDSGAAIALRVKKLLNEMMIKKELKTTSLVVENTVFYTQSFINQTHYLSLNKRFISEGFKKMILFEG